MAEFLILVVLVFVILIYSKLGELSRHIEHLNMRLAAMRPFGRPEGDLKETLQDEVPSQNEVPSQEPLQAEGPSHVPSQAEGPSHVPSQAEGPSQAPSQAEGPSHVPSQVPYEVPLPPYLASKHHHPTSRQPESDQEETSQDEVPSQNEVPSQENLAENLQETVSETNTQTDTQTNTQTYSETYAKPYTKSDTKSAREWELFIGGTWLNRIGAIAVLIGTIFFLKYAFENDLIGEWGRIIIGLVSGAALIVGGQFARKRSLVIFSQGLVGAGIPILYFSIYAAREFYFLVPFVVAFTAMAAVGALALFIALKHDAPFIAILGAVGGMVTPAVLSAGEVNTAGLFTFIALLDTALIAIALKRRDWWFIDVIVTVGTWMWWFTWLFVEDAGMLASFFAWLFFVGFIVYDRFVVADGDREYAGLNRILSLMSMAVSSLMLVLSYWTDSTPKWQNELTLVIGALVLFGAGWDIQRRGWSSSAALLRYVGAFLLLVFTPLIRNEVDITLIWWAVTATTTIFVFRRNEISTPLWMAFGLNLISVMVYALSNVPSGFEYGAWPLINWRTGPYLLVLIGALISYPYILAQNNIDKGYRSLLGWMRAGYAVLLVAALWFETFDYGHVSGDLWTAYLYRAAGTVVGMVGGLAVLWWGRKTDEAELRGTGLSIVGVGLLMVLGDIMPSLPDEHHMVIINARSITALIHLLGLIVCYRWINNRLLIGIPIGVVLFALISYESFTPFRIWDDLEAAQLALSTAWFLYGLLLMMLGFKRRSLALRIGGLVLLAISILKVFLWDLSNLEQPYRIVSFIGLGVILLAASFLYTRFKDVLFEQE